MARLNDKIPAEKAARGRNSPTRGAKDAGEELDQVAGNAEDEIGERVAAMRESELLYGEQSLLSMFGPMLVHICGNPGKFKVWAPVLWVWHTWLTISLEPHAASGCDAVTEQIPVREFAILRQAP